MSEQQLAEIEARIKGTLIEHLGIRFSAAGGGVAEASLAFRPELRQVTGRMHAGALLTLADSAASAAALSALREQGESELFPFTVQLSANLLRGISGGVATTRAQVVHSGRSMVVVESDTLDELGKLAMKLVTTHVVSGR